MKHLFILIFLASNFCFGQNSENEFKNIPKNPVYFLDSVKITSVEMANLNAQDFTLITVQNEKEMLESLQDGTKDGAIYIETRKFAKKRFVKFFNSKSKDFRKIYSLENDDSKFAYILNGKALSGNFEGGLASIKDEDLQSLQVVNKKELQKKYSISGKDYGILITAKVPEDAFKGEEKSK